MMDLFLTNWPARIYGISLIINAVVVAIVFYLVLKERKEGPAMKGTTTYWFLTRIVDIGSKEVWCRDKLNSNVWMYPDDGSETSSGDHVCTLRHEKSSIIITALIGILCPILNTFVVASMFLKIMTATVEDGIDTNRLVNYSREHYFDHVPYKSKYEYDDIDRSW